jgi:hypothetical protein
MDGQEANGDDKNQQLVGSSKGKLDTPESQPDQAQTLIQAMLGSDIVGPLALLNKFEPEHMTQLLGIFKENNAQIARDRQQQRWFALAIVLVVAVALGVFVWLLTALGLQDLIPPAFSAISVGIGGIGGGAYIARR